MKKFYHLSNCTTCQAIIKQTNILEAGFELQNIKTQKITPEQIDEMKTLSGSYEALFSRRALKYKEMGLKEVSLTENDYRRLILEEYTFLNRPVVIIHEQVFIGNHKKTIASLQKAMGQ
jgi:arsenate reductase